MPGAGASHEESVAAVRAFFDRTVGQEHDRMVGDPVARVAREVHEEFLRAHVAPGDRVLEVGAGTGRFTETLLRLGARVRVTDLSGAQLEAGRAHVTSLGLEGGVEAWEQADVCQLDRFDGDGFDAVLAYGGPLSYAFDRAGAAAAGMLRATRPDGVVVASVMSTLGTYRAMLPAVLEIDTTAGPEANARVLETGDLRELQPPAAGGHTCRMFRSDQLARLVEDAGGRVLRMSASTWASVGHEAALEVLEQDGAAWRRHVGREVDSAARPGALDGGTHLLVAYGHGGQAA